MKVRDFKLGFSIFFKTLFWCCLIVIIPLFFAFENIVSNDILNTLKIPFFIILFFIMTLPFIGFYINYTPIRIENGIVTIPASDQIRTFLDFITINPITGLYRTRKYSTKDIENVANGYTRPAIKNKSRAWNVVITGVKNGNSFSQRIDVSNKQVRDEVRNVLKKTISGRVNSEFSY